MNLAELELRRRRAIWWARHLCLEAARLQQRSRLLSGGDLQDAVEGIRGGLRKPV